MDEYYLVDAGSRNGTFIRGRRVIMPPSSGTVTKISIGSHLLLFDHPKSENASESSTVARQGLGPEARVMFVEHLVTVLVVDIEGFTRLTQVLEQDVLYRMPAIVSSDGLPDVQPFAIRQ